MSDALNKKKYLRPLWVLIIAPLLANANIACAGDEVLQDEWMAVLINGKKIGHAHTRVTRENALIVSHFEMRMEMGRGNNSTVFNVSETTHVDGDKRLVQYLSNDKMSGIQMQTRAELRGDVLHIESGGLGHTEEAQVPWQSDYRAIDQYYADDGLELRPGFKRQVRSYMPSMKSEVLLQQEITGEKTIDLLGQDFKVFELIETVAVNGMEITSVNYLDAQFSFKKSTIEIMGMKFDLLACPEVCATAPNEAFDGIGATVIPVPNNLTAAQLNRPVHYVFKSQNPLGDVQLPSGAEQQYERLDDHRFSLTVFPQARNIREAKNDAYALPSAWIQSDAPLIQSLAQQAGAGDGPAQPAQIESFVRQYIDNKTLSVGYASALETAQNRNGDCTEHALLTAAIGRAAGLQTRIAVGFAYADEFEGHRQVLVPHAWTQAHIDGRWQSLDAALNGFDSGHVALTYEDGDPARFYNGAMLTGQLRLESVKMLDAVD